MNKLNIKTNRILVAKKICHRQILSDFPYPPNGLANLAPAVEVARINRQSREKETPRKKERDRERGKKREKDIERNRLQR